MKTATLLISCQDKAGITAKITNYVFSIGGNILHADQHIDEQSNTFFMRIEWTVEGSSQGRDSISSTFKVLAEEYQMTWELFFSFEKPKLGIFVSKHLHCLYDLLWRYRAGHFNCEIPFILSNHEDAAHAAESFGVKFYHIPINIADKKETEKIQLSILRENEIDTIVLARYMQVLSPEFVANFPNEIINIHHSFLPAFKGSNPYLRAHEKGVKIIGATSHYVNDELDMGPIIEQDTVRVSHRDTVEDKVKKGQDLEKIVLSRALTWHIDHKILTYNNKTVIFD